MRIAYLSSSFFPSYAANSVQVVRMCAAFVRAGHTIDLFGGVSSDSSPSEVLRESYGVNETITLHSVKRSRLPVFGGVMNTLSFRGSWDILSRVDLVYGRDPFLIAGALRRKLPSVFELHSISPDPVKRLLVRRLLLSGNLSRLVVISEGLKEAIASRWPTALEVNDIVVAPDAADPVVAASSTIKQQFESGPRNPSSFTVGYAGSFLKGRGLKLLCEIARALPHVRFFLAGGSNEDFTRFARESPPKNVILAGRLKAPDVQMFLDKCDVLVAPYERRVHVRGGSETTAYMSPLKVFEYMAARRPIVASDLPAIREVLTDRTDALLCDPDSPHTWVGTIERLRTDVTLRTTLANQAYKKFLENYTWDGRGRRVLHRLSL